MSNQTVTPATLPLVITGFPPYISARGPQFDLGQCMDAIAQKLVQDGIVKTAYGYPPPALTVPCAVVSYPKIDFDLTFKRGADTLEFPIFFIVGGAWEKTARDTLSQVITGAVSIKTALDSNLNGEISSGRVVDCVIETYQMGDGTEYLAAKFTYQVIT